MTVEEMIRGESKNIEFKESLPRKTFSGNGQYCKRCF